MTFSNQQPFARTDRSALGLWWWTTDRFLLLAVAILIGMGVALSFGTSPAAAIRTGMSQPFHYAIRQTIFGIGAAGLVLGMSILTPRGARRASFIIYIVAIAIMCVLPFIGHAAKGADRWVQLGGFSLQPSEFMKPALIVLAAWMFAEAQKGEGVPGVSIAFGLYGVAVVLLLLQPDFGQTVLITMAFGVTFFMAGVPLRWIIGLAGVAAAGFVTVSLTFSHVHDRIHKFLSPDKADTHQIDKATEAIASGPDSPARHWCTAQCSESTGRSSAPGVSRTLSTSAAAVMSDSPAETIPSPPEPAMPMIKSFLTCTSWVETKLRP